MPRLPRQISASGIYHVVMRGTGRQNIFFDREDYRACQRIVFRVKKKYGFTLYAYCMMSNHVHFLLRTQDIPVSLVMQLICSLYAAYFNNRYDRKGHLFQGRFHSEPVEDEEYFLVVLLYIHNNPCKAGITDKMDQYLYSSYREYVRGAVGMTDVRKILRQTEAGELERLHQQKEKKTAAEANPMQRCSEEEAKFLLSTMMNDENTLKFGQLEVLRQRSYIAQLKRFEVTYAQIARLTGMPYERIRYLGRLG